MNIQRYYFSMDLYESKKSVCVGYYCRMSVALNGPGPEGNTMLRIVIKGRFSLGHGHMDLLKICKRSPDLLINVWLEVAGNYSDALEWPA